MSAAGKRAAADLVALGRRHVLGTLRAERFERARVDFLLVQYLRGVS